jgi:translation initiation factor IF-2
VSAATNDADDAGRDGPAAASPEGEAPVVAAAPGAVPLSKRGAIYTMTAREGLDAAELVNAAFARKTIGAVTPRRVEVIAPDGPSTAGGKRARQTIRLVPARGEGAPVMCGFLDVGRRLVELRSHTMVAQQYQERFGKRFDVTPQEYAGLCKDLEATLSAFRYEFAYEVEAQPAGVESVRAKLSSGAPRGGARLLNVMLAVLVVLIVGGLLGAMSLR